MECRKFDTPFRRREITDLVYGGEAVTQETFSKMSKKEIVTESEYKIFFGELHSHSNLSDAMMDPDYCFKAARDAAQLDFYALTDHDHGGVGRPELWGEKWDIVKKKVKEYYNPGKFVTILGYERDSYPWYNNLVLYYNNDNGDMVRGELDGDITKDELIALLSRKDIVAVPHTTSTLSSGCDFDCIPLELMPSLIEVYSKWGTSEYFGNENPVRVETKGGHWRDALEKGAKMGCIAASDEHGPYPGMVGQKAIATNLRQKNPGLTAILAKELTREAIFDALKNKRCYGVSGARILIDFRINEQVMGSELTVKKDERKDVYIKIAGEEALKTVTIIKNGEDYLKYHIDGVGNEFKEFFYDYKTERTTDYYYIRVEQMDGRNAWSSPIWVSVK